MATKKAKPIEVDQPQPSIKGYKVFNPDFTCNGFQYAENTEFKFVGTIKICSRGFHYCKLVQDCFKYYSFDPVNIVCEVEGFGECQTKDDDSKVCTGHIKIVRRLSWHEVLEVANSGGNNTGHSNSGNRNSGNWNSGNWNSGNWNSGNWNSGDRNSGNRNSGNRNSGNRNSGNRNSGNRNSGDRNSGDRNSGNWNSGNRNSGDSNSGNRNSGNRNSGNWNSGNRNSGDSNSGYRNSGAFCVDRNAEVWIFDKPSGILMQDWENHRAVLLMSNLDHTIWVPSSMMTDAEKERHPKHETTGGYLKTITMHEAWANMWGNLSDDDKSVFTTLPNFDAAKFLTITGIQV